MRAVIIKEHGDLDVLSYVDDFPRPQPEPGEALVRVHATGINQVDRVVRMGYPGIGIPLPHVPGGDIAGVVEELGAGASTPLPGTRVLAYPLVSCGECPLCGEGKTNLCTQWRYLGLHRNGGYSEYVSVPTANLIPLPESVGFTDAVCLPVAGLTALHALRTVGDLQPGQNFFIWGGTGSVGTMAIQIAKKLGATVTATGGTADKLQSMLALGADNVINRFDEDVPARMAELYPGGVDLALDYVGPQTFEKTMGMLKKGGSMMLCGMLTGRETNFSIQQAYLKHISIKGLYLGTKEELTELLSWFDAGLITPVIDSVIPLAEIRRAHERLESGQYFGKIAISMD